MGGGEPVTSGDFEHLALRGDVRGAAPQSLHFAFRQTRAADPLSPAADEFFFFSLVPRVPLITGSIFTVFHCHQEVKLIEHIKRPVFCSMEEERVHLRLISDV